jgi:hypothetical protein
MRLSDERRKSRFSHYQAKSDTRRKVCKGDVLATPRPIRRLGDLWTFALRHSSAACFPGRFEGRAWFRSLHLAALARGRGGVGKASGRSRD